MKMKNGGMATKGDAKMKMKNGGLATASSKVIKGPYS
jgi:hypothetical protein